MAISRRAQVSAVLAAAAALAAGPLLAPHAGAAGGEKCPNSQLRYEDDSLFLPDCRAYEMVSPVEKNGGAVARFGAISGGGVLQAAASGEAATFSSSASFGAGAVGAPVASQYVARRGAAGWATENVTGPTASGDYGEAPEGVPFQLFSAELERGLLLDGRRCAEGEPCPREYSMRDSATGALTALPAQAAGMRVAGASPDLSRLVFESEGSFYEWSGGALAPTGPPPPGPGTTRTSADGQTVAFVSDEPLTGYDNIDQATGEPDSEVFLESAAGGLRCVSCNPTGESPLGPSTMPGPVANGSGPGATRVYEPRTLSAAGTRLFFDSSDQIVDGDASAAQDVYEWEAPGTGSCAVGSRDYFASAGGCVFPISSGSSPEASEFVDASADGRDAFFLTGQSLIETDPGSVDLYDAREAGGFPLPEPQIPCEGDACQSVPSPPQDPSPGTLVAGQPNPAPHFPPVPCAGDRRRARRHGKTTCVPRRHRKHHGRHGRHRHGGHR